jgi:hypothetical protein
MTPDEIRQTSPISLCLDNERFVLPAVESEVQRRGLNCNKVIYDNYSDLSQGLSHVELCEGWINQKIKPAVRAFETEIKKRAIDCNSILLIQAQRDNTRALERASRDARWDRFDRYNRWHRYHDRYRYW